MMAVTLAAGIPASCDYGFCSCPGTQPLASGGGGNSECSDCISSCSGLGLSSCCTGVGCICEDECKYQVGPRRTCDYLQGKWELLTSTDCENPYLPCRTSYLCCPDSCNSFVDDRCGLCDWYPYQTYGCPDPIWDPNWDTGGDDDEEDNEGGQETDTHWYTDKNTGLDWLCDDYSEPWKECIDGHMEECSDDCATALAAKTLPLHSRSALESFVCDAVYCCPACHDIYLATGRFSECIFGAVANDIEFELSAPGYKICDYNCTRMTTNLPHFALQTLLLR